MIEDESPGLNDTPNGSLDRRPSGEAPRTKRRVLAAMLAANVVAQMLYLNVASLLPQFVDSYHRKFNSLDVGILFASYQIAFLIIAPIIGENLTKYGRRRALYTSVIIFTISTATYGAAGYISNDWGFYLVSLAARIFQGFADAFMLITIPSVIATEYPHKQEEYQGLFYMSLGIGLTAGPFMSWMFNAVIGLDYQMTFFAFAAMIFVFGTLVICTIPKTLDEQDQMTEEEKPIDIPFGAYFKNTRVLMALLAYFMAAVLLIFYDPILSLRIENLGLDEN